MAKSARSQRNQRIFSLALSVIVVLSMALSLIVALNPSSLQPPSPTAPPIFITPLVPEKTPTATVAVTQTPTPAIAPALPPTLKP
jgi:hypothetical protein